jgi:hypothetical protein
LQTADLLRRERPDASAVRLDEIKRDVLTKSTRSRQPRLVASMRRKLMAVSLFVLLFGLSSSSAAASLLNWVSGGSFGSNTLGYGDTSGGTKFFFGSFGWGGDSSDDAGHETYCPDDKGSDDGDGSSSDDSDGDGSDDKSFTSYTQSGGGDDGSDDGDSSSGDQSDGGGGECESDEGSESSDDGDRSSGDHSDEKSDDGDQSSDDNSDGDSKSDDGDRSSGDHSDEASDDGDQSSDDQSD